MDDLTYQICPDCLGEGIVERDMPDEYVGLVAKLITCPTCNGERKILLEYEPDEDDE